jgi:hypothetical protein
MAEENCTGASEDQLDDEMLDAESLALRLLVKNLGRSGKSRPKAGKVQAGFGERLQSFQFKEEAIPFPKASLDFVRPTASLRIHRLPARDCNSRMSA